MSDNDDDLVVLDADTGEPIEQEVPKRSDCYEVYELFEKILGIKYPHFWVRNRAIRDAGERLWNEKGRTKIITALVFYRDNKDDKFCPSIETPFDLEVKWSKLLGFKKRNEL